MVIDVKQILVAMSTALFAITLGVNSGPSQSEIDIKVCLAEPEVRRY